METILKKALEKSGADFASIYYETTTHMGMVYSKKELEQVSSRIVQGGRVVALKNGGYAAHSFTSLDTIDDAVAQAAKAAALVASFAPGNNLADAPVVKDKIHPAPAIDPRTVSFEEKKALVEEYTDLVLSFPQVFLCTLSYAESFSERYFVNTEGSDIQQNILLCRLGGRVIAKDGKVQESTGFSFGYDNDYKRLVNRHADVEVQTKAACDMLKADSVKSGSYTIICDHDLGGVFTHEAFGHLSESDDIVNNPSLKEEMKIGRVLGKPILNIVDQGNVPGAPGSFDYDDEGVATRKTYLIKDGVLTGRLCSRLTAAALDAEPTGNLRAVDYRYMPIVRMTNIFIEAGTTPPEEMFASLDNGLYLCGAKGGQTMGDIFTFGAQYGYEIKNGKRGRMVKDINISGNVFDTLGNISMIGNDLHMNEWGGCGKTRAALFDMQMLAKSGTGSPHVKVDNVIIGGK